METELLWLLLSTASLVVQSTERVPQRKELSEMNVTFCAAIFSGTVNEISPHALWNEIPSTCSVPGVFIPLVTEMFSSSANVPATGVWSDGSVIVTVPLLNPEIRFVG